MNKDLMQVFGKLRALPHGGREGLAEFFRAEGIRFSKEDFSTWGQFFLSRFASSEFAPGLPEWLLDVICSLSKGASQKVICDPWSGPGFLIEALRDVCQPKRTLAYTKALAQCELGRVLVPEVEWQHGDPLQLLDALAEPLDLAVSILPFHAKSSYPLKVTLPSGQHVELTNNLDDLLIVAASMRLSECGIGLFVVARSFFVTPQSVFPRLEELGLGVHAALALPSGTFAPFTSIPTYLILVRRKVTSRMFVAALSSDAKANAKVLENLRCSNEGSSLELGRVVDAHGFKGIDQIRAKEALDRAKERFGTPAVALETLANEIRLGRSGGQFTFEPLSNAVYVPLIGNGDVKESLEELTLKVQNYAQVIIDPAHCDARFVARYLNSEFGREIREQSKFGFIPRLNLQSLKSMQVFVPDLPTQRRMLEIETGITTEHNTVAALHNELTELRRELWASPANAPQVQQRLDALAKRLTGDIRAHASDSLEQWFETLPFPLASILRAWQATPSQDYKAKYEHLLHFFEALAEFVSVILLSAYSANEAVFEPYRQNLVQTMRKQNMTFERATFGTWKLVVEYMGKQTRELLNESGRESEGGKDSRALCAELFADPSLELPRALSQKALAGIISATNKMRNDWGGHGGVVGAAEAERRNQILLAEVQKVREVIADTWSETQLILAHHCTPRRGLFENEVALLMGSNSEFLKEKRAMSTWLDVDSLYLSKKEHGKALKLLPLIQVGASPQSARNACYFFSRLEGDGARFVSYHFADCADITDQFTDATAVINLLRRPD